MKVFFDTSALIAVMLEDEVSHREADAEFEAAIEIWISTHSIAECFSTLTGGRRKSRLTPQEALEVITTTLNDRVHLLPLTRADYEAALAAAAGVGARGGAIYDVLLLTCARRSGAARILTLNHRHFVSFAPDLAGLIATPG